MKHLGQLAGLAFACLLVLTAGSCRDKPKKGAMSPEAFYAATIEFSDLNVEFKQKSLAILEKHESITPEAHEELRAVSEDARKRHQAVMDKYGLEGPDWAKDGPGKNERDAYLEEHPEIKKRLDDNKTKMIELADRINEYTIKRNPPKKRPAPQQEPLIKNKED